EIEGRAKHAEALAIATHQQSSIVGEACLPERKIVVDQTRGHDRDVAAAEGLFPAQAVLAAIDIASAHFGSALEWVNVVLSARLRVLVELRVRHVEQAPCPRR